MIDVFHLFPLYYCWTIQKVYVKYEKSIGLKLKVIFKYVLIHWVVFSATQEAQIRSLNIIKIIKLFSIK